MQQASVVVLGGGMLGGLLQWLWPHATVLDWRKPPSKGMPHAPRAFGAMYLHRRLEGLPCRDFSVFTTMDDAPVTGESFERVAAYKAKVGKPDDMHDPMWQAQFPHGTTGFRLEQPIMVEAHYNWHVRTIDPRTHIIESQAGDRVQYDRLFSTVPLASLMEMLELTLPAPLHHHPISVRVTALPPDAPQSRRDHPGTMWVNYVSDPDTPVYRTTDFQGERHYEWMYRSQQDMGLTTKLLTPGKIYAAPWTEPFLTWLNANHIYPLGRAGRWRPNELLHDSYADALQMRVDWGA